MSPWSRKWIGLFVLANVASGMNLARAEEDAAAPATEPTTGPTSGTEEGAALGTKIAPGARLLLQLDTGVSNTSNFYFQDNGQVTANSVYIRPAATLGVDHGTLQYKLIGSVDAAAADVGGSADDYADNKIKGEAQWDPLTRQHFRGGLYLNDGHDPFGSRRTEALGTAHTDLDKWTETGGNLGYRFGASDAPINLEAEYTGLDRSYNTNTAFTRYLDYSSNTFRGTAYYNLSSKTSFLAEAIRGNISYDHVLPGFQDRSGDLSRYHIGIKWLATGKTAGDFRIGKVKRDFDSNLKGFDAVDWEAAVTWSPRERDLLKFTTGREAEESYINSSSMIDDEYGEVSWIHEWTALTSSTVAYKYARLDFRDIGRLDKVQDALVGLNYRASRHWTLYGQVSFEQRDTNASLRNFDNTVVATGIRLAY